MKTFFYYSFTWGSLIFIHKSINQSDSLKISHKSAILFLEKNHFLQKILQKDYFFKMDEKKNWLITVFQHQKVMMNLDQKEEQ